MCHRAPSKPLHVAEAVSCVVEHLLQFSDPATILEGERVGSSLPEVQLRHEFAHMEDDCVEIRVDVADHAWIQPAVVSLSITRLDTSESPSVSTLESLFRPILAPWPWNSK